MNEPWKKGVKEAGHWLTRYLNAFPFLVLTDSVAGRVSCPPSGSTVASSDRTSSGTPAAVWTVPRATARGPGVFPSMMDTTA